MPDFNDESFKRRNDNGGAGTINLDAARAQFRDAMRARGIEPPAEIIDDGEIHRCDTTGRNGEGDASYIFYTDGIPAGGFQNWQDTHGWQNWHASIGRAFTPAEDAELRRKREAEQAKRKAEREQRRTDAEARAKAIWDESVVPEPNNEDCPYLARKKVRTHGARRQRSGYGAIVPMYDDSGALRNLQTIYPDGEKRFLPGGVKAGARYAIGDLDASDAILIGEGFATCATAHEATGRASVVAFDSGNLRAVAESLRAKYPAKPIVLLADDDWRTKLPDGTLFNVGVSKAREAAIAVNGYITIPQFGPERADSDTDFNDIARLYGLDAAKKQIFEAKNAHSQGAPQQEPGAKRKTQLEVLIDSFNSRYAVVNEAGKAIIYEPTTDPALQRKVLTRITFEDLKKFYQNKRLTITTPDGKSITKTHAVWWLDSESRRQFLGGVTFNPKGGAPEDMWNLWTGFGVLPMPGDWSLLRSHIELVVCGGDKVHAEYLLNWIAYVFQNPHRPGEIAVVLRGGKGCGKGILFRWIAKAWGQHGLQISYAKHLVGNFNAHLRDLVFLFADEAFYAADKEHESVLKALVTEPTLPIEGKHMNIITVPNMLHIGMASNSEWVVPASADERRWFVRDVLETCVGDYDYFAAIEAQMEAGGLAAMIYDMLRRDISRFNVRNVPASAALEEQKKHTLDSLDQWWLDCLSRGFVWRSKFGESTFDEWQTFAATELLMASYLQWCSARRIARPQSRVALGKRMAEAYPAFRETKDEIIGEVEVLTAGKSSVIKRANMHGYTMQGLDDARVAFIRARKIRGEW